MALNNAGPCVGRVDDGLIVYSDLCYHRTRCVLTSLHALTISLGLHPRDKAYVKDVISELCPNRMRNWRCAVKLDEVATQLAIPS